MKKLIVTIAIIPMLFIYGCREIDQIEEPTFSPQMAFDSLISYIERNGNFINSPSVPAMITAYELYSKLDSNTLVLDTRTSEEFSNAHIENSINIPFNQLLNYFENRIDPNSFNRIVLVCNAGQTASYATSILRILGYSNVFALKWGFSSWHRETAEARWLSRVSNKYTEMLEFTPNPKSSPTNFPEIETKERFGYTILRERAHRLFAEEFNPITLNADSLFGSEGRFYILNYWPENLYNKGHITGAIQYQPKKSLSSTEQLNTLPTDRPIAVYCFTGQHSAFVTAYLRLLGYDARTLSYGANGFMRSIMLQEKIDNVFTEKDIYNLPVSSGGVASKPIKVEEVVIAPRGGC